MLNNFRIPLLLITLLAMCFSSSHAEGNKEKTLKFPSDRSMGTLKSYDVKASKWIELGEAKGTVKLPADSPVVFILTAEGVKDLTPLKDFPEDAFDQMVFDDLKIEANGLESLAALKKLKKVSMRGCDAGDEALGKLESLTELRELDLALTGLGDEGMKKLSALTNLESLDISSTLVSDKSVEAICKLKSLTYLDPQKSAMTPEGMEKIRDALPACSIPER